MADLLCPVLIGRDAESGRLRSALGAAQDGMGRMVFLTGEAGIGKSRLASELADEARARGATVLAGRAVPTSASIPYRPLTEALLHALRERTFPDDPALTPWLPALQAMIPTIAGPGVMVTATTQPRYAAKRCCQAAARVQPGSRCTSSWPTRRWMEPGGPPRGGS